MKFIDNLGHIKFGETIIYGNNISMTEDIDGRIVINAAILSGTGGSTTLAGLSDVTLTSLQNDQFLRYDTGSTRWINQLLTAADIGAGIFKTGTFTLPGRLNLSAGPLVIGTDPDPLGSDVIRVTGSIRITDTTQQISRFISTNGSSFILLTCATGFAAILEWNNDFSIENYHSAGIKQLGCFDLTTGTQVWVIEAGLKAFRSGTTNDVDLGSPAYYWKNLFSNNVITNNVIIGPDPGGSQILRVGGTAYLGDVTTIGTDPGGSELLRIGGNVRIGSLGVVDSTHTPTGPDSSSVGWGKVLSYNTTSSQWQPRTLQLSFNSGQVTAGNSPAGDGTTVALVNTNPTLVGTPTPPISAPILTPVYRGIIIDMSAYVLGLTQQYVLDYSIDSGISYTSSALISTGSKVIHSNLHPEWGYRYKYKIRGAVDSLYGAESVDVNPSNISEANAFGIILASQISTVNLAAVNADLGIISAGRIDNASSNPTAGILLAGGYATPITWTKGIFLTGGNPPIANVQSYIDFSATGSNKTFNFPGYSVTADGTAIFNGIVTTANLQVNGLAEIDGAFISSGTSLIRHLQHSILGDYGDSTVRRVILDNNNVQVIGDAGTGNNNETVRVGSFTIAATPINRTTANILDSGSRGWVDPDGIDNGINTLNRATDGTSTVVSGSRLFCRLGDPSIGVNVDAYDDTYTFNVQVSASYTGTSTNATVQTIVEGEYSIDSGVTWTVVGNIASVSAGTLPFFHNPVSAQYTCNITVPGAPTNVWIRLRMSLICSNLGSGSGDGSVRCFASVYRTNNYAVTWRTATNPRVRRGLKSFSTTDGTNSMPHYYMEPLANTTPAASMEEGEFEYVGGSVHGLMLKDNVGLWRLTQRGMNWAGSTGTGSSVLNVDLHSIAVDGGRVGPNGAIRVTGWGVVTGTTNTKFIRVRLDGSNDSIVFSWDAADEGWWYLDALCVNQNSESSQRNGGTLSTIAASSTVGALFGTIDIRTSAIDTANALLVGIIGQTTNSADEVTLNGLSVQVLPG